MIIRLFNDASISKMICVKLSTYTMLPPLALIDQLSMTRTLPMVCRSLIVNNKIIEISKLLEECGLSRPPCRTFARYLHLVAATGLLSAVPIPLHWTIWDDLLFVGRGVALADFDSFQPEGSWVRLPL